MIRCGVRVAVAAVVAASATSAAEVQIVRKADGSTVISNQVGSGWLVNGRAPSDDYLVERRAAPGPWDDAIRATSLPRGVDPQIVKSVMLVESNFNPRAVSRKGAGGLMQLMPETARRFGVRDRFDPLENLRGGVEYLASLLKLYAGDLALALAAYNAGENAVARYAGCRRTPRRGNTSAAPWSHTGERPRRPSEAASRGARPRRRPRTGRACRRPCPCASPA